MPRYPKQPLEERLAWMRQKQIQKQAEAAVRAGEESRRARLAAGEPRYLPQPVPEPQPVIRPAARKMLRAHHVAEILSISTRTAQRWFADRAIIVQTGPTKTTMLIPEQALDDWFREHAPKVS